MKCSINLYLNDTFDYANSKVIPSDNIKVQIQIFINQSEEIFQFSVTGIENTIKLFEDMTDTGFQTNIFKSNEDEISITMLTDTIAFSTTSTTVHIVKNKIFMNEINKILHNYRTKENPVFINNFI